MSSSAAINSFAVSCTSNLSIRFCRSCSSDLLPQVDRLLQLEDTASQVDVLGHAPKLMALWLTKFLKRQTNSGKVIVKGKHVNRGGGYGLEIPCEYHFHGDTFSCQWLKGKLTQEKFKLLE